MDQLRRWMRICEGLQQSVRHFIEQAQHFAAQCGVHAKLEPLAIGNGVQITWMERRRDDRVKIEEFLTQLTRLADDDQMPLQLAIPGHDPSNETLFAHHGFKIDVGDPDLIMQREPEPTYITDFAESALAEKSPPGWEGTTKSMKKHKDISNPWALSWYMKNKGYHSHKTKTGKKKS